MRRLTGFAFVLVVLAVVFAFAPAASAQEAGEKNFDIYAGYYVPGIDDLDNDITYGIRFGGRPSENWGWDISAGYFDLNQNNNQPLSGRINSADAWLVDLDGIWYIGGSDFGLRAGVGFATANIDIEGTTRDESDDAFTYNGGVLYAFNFGDRFVVRPQVLVRKFEGDTYEKTVEEYTISFGWRW